MPCDVVGLDVEDNLGYHVVDYYGEMNKIRLDKDGNMLEIETFDEKNAPRDELL